MLNCCILICCIVVVFKALHSKKKGFLQELKKVLRSGPGGEPFLVLRRTFD